jgi:2-C-methyl-D-erythritol 2,4-cyclodiphosphate synthase
MARDIRIGHGFDAHRLMRGRRLMLGGIHIPHDKGLKGHSDADVVLHAMINAVLGAIGAGDIGTHFPDSDPRYKNIASSELLTGALGIMRRKRFKLVNVDLTIVAQAPKLAPHYGAMRESIARLCRVSQERINVKAATTEKLGWIGQGKGMAATAVILVER